MKFLLGVVIGAILVPLAVVAYLMSGYAPAAVADPPMPFEARIAGMALQKRIQKEAPVRDLSGMSTPDLLAGAEIYKKNCVMCHGLPDQKPEIADNMYPAGATGNEGAAGSRRTARSAGRSDGTEGATT